MNFMNMLTSFLKEASTKDVERCDVGRCALR